MRSNPPAIDCQLYLEVDFSPVRSKDASFSTQGTGVIDSVLLYTSTLSRYQGVGGESAGPAIAR